MHCSRLREAGGRRDQDVVDAAVAQLIEVLQPELRSFGLLDPDAQHVTCAVGQASQRQIDRRFFKAW